MSTTETCLNRIPTLAQYCYRFINSHLDSIESLGDIPYPLVKPVLRSCSAEQLLTIEKNSPHLGRENQDVWKSLCFRDFRRAEQQYEKGGFKEPVSWRKQYFICRASEEKRLEEVGSRIKIKRQEAEEEKKERQVVFTDRIPPPKKTRFNPSSSRPKSLLEKAKAESIRIQRSVYGSAKLNSLPAPKAIKSTPIRSKINHVAQKGNTGVIGGAKAARPNKASTSNVSPELAPSPSVVTTSAVPPASGGRTLAKKDPMATLFMPKHRAHSQLPYNSPLSLQRAA